MFVVTLKSLPAGRGQIGVDKLTPGHYDTDISRRLNK